jgi:hypothetical protein
MDNRAIAERLVNYAHQLEGRDENLYRVQAYRRAAETVMGLDRPVAEVVAESGRDGLEALPGIGAHLSYTIEGLVRTGEFRTWQGGGGRVDAERVFAALPGVGPRLARQIHEQLGVETLEELEQVAHEGRLAGLGVGPKRLRGIRDALAVRQSRPRPALAVEDEPPAAELLAVDHEYRDLAVRGELPRIAPRRFNPSGEARLPVWRVRRDRWRYRVLFSNTAAAHRLGRTHDWVVIYFEEATDPRRVGQRTVVTEARGERRGRRVVRGREGECHEAATPAAEAAVPAGSAG